MIEKKLSHSILCCKHQQIGILHHFSSKIEPHLHQAGIIIKLLLQVFKYNDVQIPKYTGDNK